MAHEAFHRDATRESEPIVDDHEAADASSFAIFEIERESNEPNDT